MYQAGRLIICLFIILTASQLVIAQDKKSISLEMAGVLLAHDRDAIQLNKISNKFPKIKLVKELALYASYEHKHRGDQATVIFQSKLNKSESKIIVEQMLKDNDWFVRKVNLDLPNTGFISGNKKPYVNKNGPYCHSAYGNIQVSIHELSNLSSVVSLLFYPHHNDSQKCIIDARNPILQRKIDVIYPKLQVPDNFKNIQISGGRSGNFDNFEKHSEFKIDTKIDKNILYDHFVSQMKLQGWTEDDNWSGNTSTGGVWLKDNSHYKQFLAVITIVNLSDNYIRVKLSVQTLSHIKPAFNYKAASVTESQSTS